MGQEQFFICPYCHQSISVVLDPTIAEIQVYVEDCEVCCRPIQITYQGDGTDVVSFSFEATQSHFN